MPPVRQARPCSAPRDGPVEPRDEVGDHLVLVRLLVDLVPRPVVDLHGDVGEPPTPPVAPQTVISLAIVMIASLLNGVS